MIIEIESHLLTHVGNKPTKTFMVVVTLIPVNPRRVVRIAAMLSLSDALKAVRLNNLFLFSPFSD